MMIKKTFIAGLILTGFSYLLAYFFMLVLLMFGFNLKIDSWWVVVLYPVFQLVVVQLSSFSTDLMGGNSGSKNS